jgi:tRNA pseudouridine13 synthase
MPPFLRVRAKACRSIKSEASREEIDAHLDGIRTKGFVNFYGMQRFGTSTVPTHITGLFMLQSRWTEAVDSVLSLREGEHPECVRARLAWLEDQDINKALDYMPRRCVAERSIWEHWRKSDQKDKLGALGSVGRSLVQSALRSRLTS